MSEDLAERLTEAGAAVLTASARRSRAGRLIDMLSTTWLRRREYDVAHVDLFSGPAMVWAEAVCWTLRRARMPCVLTLRGGGLPAYARRWPGRVARLLRGAHAVTTPSGWLREEMALYRSDIRLLPNPIAIERYPFAPPEGPPRLTWLRAFHTIYDPSLAIRVLALLSDEFPGLTLTMTGPDRDGSLSRARALATRLGLVGRITFEGPVAKLRVPANLARGGVFLNTSKVDNCPVTVLEALAAGLPVVSTRVGGIPYLLEHEHDALLVPPTDPAAMAAAVRRLLTNPELAGRLARAGREKAEGCDWTHILPKWLELFSEVTSG